jgi:hypothetical protein
MHDTLRITGRVHAVLYGPDGEVKEAREMPNAVVNAGRTWLLNMASQASPPTKMGYIALGTGATAPTTSDTALQTEMAGSRTATTNNGAVAGQSIVFTCTFVPGVATGSLTEAGIFNASSGGTMLARVTFGTLTKNAADTLTITWTVTLN